MAFLDADSIKILKDNIHNERTRLFNLIVDNFSGNEFTYRDLENLYNNQNTQNNQNIEEKQVINIKPKKIIVDNCKCEARILKNNTFMQCTRSKMDNYKYCGLHKNQINRKGLPYGDIHSKCPDVPVLKSRGRPKKLNIDNLVIDDNL
jgi:hypothetical protein